MRHSVGCAGYTLARLALFGYVALGCTQVAVIPAKDDGGAADAGGPTSQSPLPALPLKTSSRFIVDANGARIKLAGVNWYGAESATLIPDGLQLNERHAIAKLIHDMGFNSVRLPWCNELVATNPVADATRLGKNPDLVGKSALEVFDAVVDALAEQGLLVILDNHRSRGDWCCDTIHGDGLWYTQDYPEDQFIAHWQFMTDRYKTQPAVIGADLRNELRSQLIAGAPASCGGDCSDPTDADPAPACLCESASWGDSTRNYRDWTVEAEKAGNAILSSASNWLIFVEGPNYASWLGANYRPLQLAVPNRLVYSAHNYKTSQTFTDCPTLKTALDGRFGFVLTENTAYTAPLWIGEFGIEHDGTSDAWWQCFTEYLTEKDADWAYWPLNGTEGPGYNRSDGAVEGYGVLNSTWDAAANADHLAMLKALTTATMNP
ncbi:MAG TPA: cellulase family glycosylhydrolase [Polyangiaceae bacterium]|jgi:endoglucanase